MRIALGVPGSDLAPLLWLAGGALVGLALWWRSRASRVAGQVRDLERALEVARAALGSPARGEEALTQVCEHAATLLDCGVVRVLRACGADGSLEVAGSVARSGSDRGSVAPLPGAGLVRALLARGRLQDGRVFALALRDRAGAPCGALWCESDQPLAVSLAQERILEALARRAEAGLVPAGGADATPALGTARGGLGSLTRVAEAAADAIFVTDERGQIQWVNGAFESITGWQRDEVQGRKASLLKSGVHDLEFYRHLWHEISAGRAWSGRFVNRRKDGRIYHAAQTIAPLVEADGSTHGYVAVQRDVSAEVERELQLLHLQEELGQSARQLEDKNRHLEQLRKAAAEASAIKGRFLERTSHEMRTPLHGMMGFLDLLLESEPDAWRRGLLVSARSSGRQLAAMIDDFLDVSQIEAAEKQEPESAEFELESALEGLLSLHEQRARDKGLEFRHTLRPPRPPRLRGDATRLRRILKYVLDRQIRDAAAGTVEFGLDARGAGTGRAELVIRVQSSAPADDQGVEIALARRLVESLGGKLEMTAAAGSGSTCRLRVVMKRVESDGEPDAVLADSAAGVPASTLGRVLVVDDNPVNQKVAHLVLSRARYEVHLADDGRQAVEKAAATPYDLILMDCQMPVMDGFEATRAIRAQETGRHVPIVAMTARTLDGDRSRCLAAGMDDFLPKPVQVEELRRVAGSYAGGGHATPAGGPQAAVPVLAASEYPGIVDRLRELGVLAEPELVIESLDLFRTDLDAVLDALEKSVARIDHVANESLGHRLKGAASNLGALRLAELASRVEEAGRRREPPSLAELTVEAVRLRAFLEQFVAGLQRPTSGAPR